MPELPEVEVTRLSFADRIQGARIQSLSLGKPLRWPLGVEPSTLVGRSVLGVRRRGKYLLIDLDQGLLLLHLGMSGSVQFGHGLPPRQVHDHVELCTDRGTLRLHDPRRFGAVIHVHSESDPRARKLLDGLGVEPLSPFFTPEGLHAGLQLRRSPIKSVLLAGDLVVGVGNIYASESLFLAGIRPTLAAQRISRPRAARLHAAIRTVLQQALDSGGSTLRDYRNGLGQTGHFQLQVKVYGRDGEPCDVCATPIRRIVQGQRATYYCPTCQKA